MGARTLLEKVVEAGEQPREKAPQRAIVLPSLRPYLPRRAHLRRILRGLAILIRMGWKGVRTAIRSTVTPSRPKAAKKPVEKDSKGEDKTSGLGEVLDGLERAGAAALIVIVTGAAGGAILSALAHTLWTPVRPYAWILCTAGLAGLLTAAWIVGPDTPGEQPTKPPAAGGEAAPEPAPLPQAAPPLDAATIAATVRKIAAPRGWKGAHLDDILAHLPGRSREELLAVLAEAEIPVENQLKLRLPGGRQRNRQGIRLPHLPAAPDQPAVPGPPEPPAEAAPEPPPPATTVTVYGAK